MSVKHTPGPWNIETPMEHEFWIVQSGKETYEWFPIATCPLPDEDMHLIASAQVKANARLIAAAPEMLAALKAVVSALDGRVHSNPALSALSRAQGTIAKAEGR